MSETPYELQRLVTVGTFSTPWEAQIAQARLSAEGLHSLIANEHVIRLVALSNAVGGVQLKVREQDAVAAAEVLRRLAPLPEIYLAADAGPTAEAAAGEMAVSATGTADTADTAAAAPGGPSCPACGSFDLRPERSSRLVLGVLPLARRGYRCGDCGTLWQPTELAGGAPPRPGPADQEGEAEEPEIGEDENAALCTVARFHTPWEAHLARTFLESEGLRCCVLEERLPAVHLLSAAPAAYNRLEVRRQDAAHAAAILARAWSSPPLSAVPDPDADDEGPEDAAPEPGPATADDDPGDPTAG